MKLAIVTSRYPKENQPYNHMFVHVRALYFQAQGVDVTLLVPAKKKETYVFEGIPVKEATSTEIAADLGAYDVLYLHLLNQYPTQDGGFEIYNKIIEKKYKTAIYLHGSDTLIYPDGFFDFKWTLRGVAKYCYTNGWKRYYMARFFHQLIKNRSHAIITPSNWLATRVATIYDLKNEQINIIPNGIDVHTFAKSGGFENRYKILCIRPLNSEYPVEDCVRLMCYLPEKFTLNIYGQGDDYNKIIHLIKEWNLENRVTIEDCFFGREELPQLFQQYGIFNAFSKSDTQGVTMCEALASKLLVLSTNKTAIPEFIKDDHSGLLYDEKEDLAHFADRIVALCKDEEKFNTMIELGRQAMEQISWEAQGEKELEVLRTL